MQSWQVQLDNLRLWSFLKFVKSISKKLKEFVVQISLKLVFVNWWALFCWVTVSSVNHNLNFSELFVSPVLYLFVFCSFIPFIILGIKFAHLLFLCLFAFAFWVHHRLDFWVHESLVFYVRKYHIFARLLSEALGCFGSWKNFPASLLAFRSDPSSPTGRVCYSFIKVGLGQLHEFSFVMFHGIFFGWKECLGGWVKMIRIVQVFEGSSLFGLEGDSAWVLFRLIHVGIPIEK